MGFLSRVPIGHDERAWESFRATPVAFPLAGYLVGALLVLPAALAVPAPTVAIAFVAWVYAVTGINHLDGLADLGDAVVVHGDADDRRRVMKDASAGVGAVLAVALVVAGLALAGLALSGLPLLAAGLIITAEVGAKLGMATVVCLGSAAHRGLGSQLTDRATPRMLVWPAAVALPAALITWPSPAAGIALAAGVLPALGLLGWARRRLGGVGGDVIGAANELGRVVALHAGVIAWTLF